MSNKLLEATSVTDITGGMNDIANSLNNYGPLITISSIFIVLFIIMAVVLVYMFILLYKERIKDKKEDDTLKDASNKLLIDMLTKLSDQMTNNKESLQNEIKEASHTHPPKGSNNNLVGVYIDVNMAFKDASRIVFEALNVDRIAIYVFHNGNRSTHGLPFFKMSCIHEWNRNKGFSMRGKNHIDLPLHMYSDMVETLYNKSEYYISDINAEKLEDYGMRDFVIYSNSRSLFALAIKDELDNLCGFSIVEYNNTTDFSNPDTYDKVKDSLEIMNGSIKFIIANNEFREKYNGNN